ncbi:Phox homologous domain-containing protein [Baffinella frigidus]|nr:Phox homologous domain-containing protein [Cryptophyta sp. CCMP2293]|mmetsp:Transcript_25276/g.60414  ORF Transcript_25276/g.60414 Transcript_25276/m.60414 type:complete len:247 (+) Transcript_25276:1-741(+)
MSVKEAHGDVDACVVLGRVVGVQVVETRNVAEKGKRHTEYMVQVALDSGEAFLLPKRYRDFRDLYDNLVHLHNGPSSTAGTLVEMPPVCAQLFRSPLSSLWFNRFDPELVECRRVWLADFLDHLAQNPLLRSCRLLHNFLCLANVGGFIGEQQQGEAPSPLPETPAPEEASPRDGAHQVANQSPTVWQDCSEAHPPALLSPLGSGSSSSSSAEETLYLRCGDALPHAPLLNGSAASSLRARVAQHA